jgi:hypothetical protein
MASYAPSLNVVRFTASFMLHERVTGRSLSSAAGDCFGPPDDEKKKWGRITPAP